MLSCFSPISLFVTLWTVACQAPLSVGFSRQEYRNGLPFPLPGELPNSGIEPVSLMSPALAGRFFTTSESWGVPRIWANKMQILPAAVISSFQNGYCFKIIRIVHAYLEKTLESPLDCKEIQPVHPKDQSWVFIGRTDAEPESPILWPPDVKSWLIWKDPDVGKDWGQEEKGTTQDEVDGWHHWLNGHGFGWTLGVGDGQGGLACWDHGVAKSWTWLRDWTELNILIKKIR